MLFLLEFSASFLLVEDACMRILSNIGILNFLKNMSCANPLTCCCNICVVHLSKWTNVTFC